MQNNTYIIERLYDSTLIKLLESKLITVLIGPRQSGKTTSINKFLKTINFNRKLCLNMDSSFERERIKKIENYLEEKIEETIGTKIGFLNEKFYLFIDESQKLPEIFETIKIIYDKYPQIKIILSGSSSLEILDKTAETLAGRVNNLKILPFSMSEASLYKNIDNFECAKPLYKNIFSCSINQKQISNLINNYKPKSSNKKKLIEILLTRSLFPPTFSKINEHEIPAWLEDYIDTYIEKDMRSVEDIGNIEAYRKVVYQLASRLGSLLEYKQLGSDASVNQVTVKKYVNIWEESLTGFLLEPFFVNLSTRIKKSKKVYFFDNALAWAMNDFKDKKLLNASGEIGNYFENLIIGDFIKWAGNCSPAPHFYFWEKSNVCEVDLVIKTEGMVIPIEIKMGNQLKKNFIHGLETFKTMHQEKGIKVPFSLIIYNGDFCVPAKNIFCLPAWLFV